MNMHKKVASFILGIYLIYKIIMLFFTSPISAFIIVYNISNMNNKPLMNFALIIDKHNSCFFVFIQDLVIWLLWAYWKTDLKQI